MSTFYFTVIFFCFFFCKYQTTYFSKQTIHAVICRPTYQAYLSSLLTYTEQFVMLECLLHLFLLQWDVLPLLTVLVSVVLPIYVPPMTRPSSSAQSSSDVTTIIPALHGQETPPLAIFSPMPFSRLLSKYWPYLMCASSAPGTYHCLLPWKYFHDIVIMTNSIVN